MKKAFTLIELLVVIAIIAILAAILFPVFAQAKLAAKKTVDLSNMKQIGTVFMLYGQDNDDRFPLTSFPSKGNTWPMTCQAYIKNWDMFRSPGDLSTLWPAAGTKPPQPDTPATDARWNFRWTSYLLSAYISGAYTSPTGSSGEFSVQSSLNSPANVVYVALARDDVAPRDHFHGFYWGTPSEQTSGYMQNLTFDATNNITKEIKLNAFGEGCNFTYVDGHAKFGKWSQLWWRNIPNGIYAGSFDPRNSGR
jgi:prepilin-type N-terminal cleavage/methylation domain-containing protein/prepilin-type processing-associated H-X9-DG protein